MKWKWKYFSPSGLGGHPRSIKLGSEQNQTRLLASICTQAPTLQGRYLHVCTEQHDARPPFRSNEFTSERSCRNSSASPH